MTVAPLIAMKSTKCESLEAVGKELDRRAHTYANDVDQSGRHVGYLCRAGDESPVPLEQAIERRMGELNTKRKIRDNQVRAMGFIVSSNDALDEKDAREFLDRSVQWFGARYGYENLLAAQIHLGEGTPHAHIWIAPVIRGEDGHDRLCAKELFAPDKRRKNADGKWEVTAQGTMSRLQEDFWEQVAECKVQVEGFAARFERIKAELAQIAECLSVRGFLGSFKAKLVEFAENPICKAALAAGRDFMTARDGRRAEKVLVDGAREKVGEMGELSRKMDEWSLLDEVGDMRGARRELDVHEAPARPLDNQVL